MEGLKIIISLTFLLVCCFSSISAYSETSALQTFENNEFGFSFKIPHGWKKLDSSLVPGVKALVKSGAKGASSNCNIRAVLNEKFKSISSKEYISMVYPNNDPSDFISEYKASGFNPELIKSRHMSIDGSEAVYVEVYITNQGHRFQTFNAQFLKKGGLYTIGCTDIPKSFSSSKKEFSILLDSFKIHLQ